MSVNSASARALSTLPAGRWRVLHRAQSPVGRLAYVDRVVVGPPGIVVIASHRASVDVPGSATGRDAAVAAVADAAIAVAELVPGMDPDLVVPVLCTSDEEPARRVHDVLVCSIDDLTQVLLGLEKSLERVHVDELFTRLQRSMPSTGFSTDASSIRDLPALSVWSRRVARRRTKTKHLPWAPYSEAGPGARAIVHGLLCLMVCAAIQSVVWPVANRFVALVASLF